MESIMDLPKVFLGSLSKGGFSHSFSDFYNPYDGWRVYILKGGPGTGKSTFLKQMADTAVKLKENVIIAPCSSDPDSLDAVIFENRKVMIADGTAPHIMEPKYPIACEQIVNLGECIDSKKIWEYRQEIFSLCFEHQAFCKRAQRYINAVQMLLSDNYYIALKQTDMKKALKFADSVTNEFLTQKQQRNAKETFVRLSAVTPGGITSFNDTPLKLCKNVIPVCDKYGAAADIVIKRIRDNCKNYGYDIFTAQNSISNEKLDAVMVPSAGFAVCIQNDYIKPNSDSRKVHSRRFTSESKMRNNKCRVNFNTKTSNEMIKEASYSMKAANMIHARLEEYYINAVDFKKTDMMKIKLEKEIFTD